MWGAQCACHEFMNLTGASKSTCKTKGEGCKQLGGLRKLYPSCTSMGKWKVKPNINLAKICCDTQKCAQTFFLTLVGHLVLRHKGLWRTISMYVKGCALDGLAKFKPRKVSNKGKVAANVC